MGTKAEARDALAVSLEKIEEKDIQALGEYTNSIRQLKTILEELKPSYKQLLDKQKAGADPNTLKTTARQLQDKVNTHQAPPDIILPINITSRLGNFPTASELFKKMSQDITLTSSVQLSSNIYENPFRISIWVEKITHILLQIENLMLEINKSKKA